MTKKFDYTTPFVNSKTGVRGVSFDATREVWVAKISYNGRRISLGSFPTLDQAQDAYTEVAEAIRSRAEQDLAARKREKLQAILDSVRT